MEHADGAEANASAAASASSGSSASGTTGTLLVHGDKQRGTPRACWEKREQFPGRELFPPSSSSSYAPDSSLVPVLPDCHWSHLNEIVPTVQPCEDPVVHSSPHPTISPSPPTQDTPKIHPPTPKLHPPSPKLNPRTTHPAPRSIQIAPPPFPTDLRSTHADPRSTHPNPKSAHPAPRSTHPGPRSVHTATRSTHPAPTSTSKYY